MTKTIDVGNDFSRYPGGRVRTDGQYSGEAFRDDFLIPALRNYESIEIIIDNVIGYGSSFLEECFGGLVRSGFTPNELKKKIQIKFSRPEFEIYKKEIFEYIDQA